MDHFTSLGRQLYLRIALFMVTVGFSAAALLWVLLSFVSLSPAVVLGGTMLGVIIMSAILALLLRDIALEPLRTLRQAIAHVSPNNHITSAPNIDELRIGRELINQLALQVYQFASQQDSSELIAHRKQIIQASNIVSHMPLPMFVFNKDLQITNASTVSFDYCGVTSAELFGKPIHEVLRLDFATEFTLEQWISECQGNRVTDSAYWERVRVHLPDDETIKQCDLSAYYNRDNPSGADFIVMIFDRTAQYNEDDRSMSFVALAVHELRTPLTMLKGYIEVFQDELDGKLNDELKGFMQKMEASANRLTAFVHNILNVARIDNDQLALHLSEEQWEDVLKQGASDQILRSETMGRTINFSIPPNLPTVAADRISMYEVVNNLIDNALKYSSKATNSDVNVVVTINSDGDIETTVQDFGVGIPESVVQNLFEKFYRNHRTRSNIGGTGLGLYLSKALVTAHGGHIWVSSKEGEGSTFGFTIQPYAKFAANQETNAEGTITRQAHGWIKNHNLYKR